MTLYHKTIKIKNDKNIKEKLDICNQKIIKYILYEKPYKIINFINMYFT